MPENIKTLSDTTALMVSEDYKERFKAEYYQTKIRYEKLKMYCNKIELEDFLSDPVPHDCPYHILREQQRHMGEYLHILELRALIEKIEL